MIEVADGGLVLALDGSTRASTAALLTRPPEWRVLARRADTDAHGQARVLLRLVDDMLHQIGRGPADIAAIVVGIGPGTFTGVRIAVATARALALALPSPVVGVGTLSALAAEAAWRAAGAARLAAGHGSAAQAAVQGRSHAPDLIVPVVDARRGQVFYGVYRASGVAAERRYAREEAFAVCDRGELVAGVEQAVGEVGERRRVLIVGEVEGLSGSDGPFSAPGLDLDILAVEVRAERLVAGQRALVGTAGAAEGAWLGPWLQGVVGGHPADRRATFCAGELGSPEAVRPIYVRSPDADLHITKMRDPWAEPASGR
jgi:tRNA threonylcarbamoyladenosine biosynthesis protein TsaB